MQITCPPLLAWTVSSSVRHPLQASWQFLFCFLCSVAVLSRNSIIQVFLYPFSLPSEAFCSATTDWLNILTCLVQHCCQQKAPAPGMMLSGCNLALQQLRGNCCNGCNTPFSSAGLPCRAGNAKRRKRNEANSTHSRTQSVPSHVSCCQTTAAAWSSEASESSCVMQQQNATLGSLPIHIVSFDCTIEQPELATLHVFISDTTYAAVDQTGHGSAGQGYHLLQCSDRYLAGCRPGQCMPRCAPSLCA